METLKFKMKGVACNGFASLFVPRHYTVAALIVFNVQ